MKNYMCKCGDYEVEEICISFKCTQKKRFCCLVCANDNYMNRQSLIKTFLRNAQELKENRYQQILYLFQQFKSLYQQSQLISNQQYDALCQLFQEILINQECLNEQNTIKFQVIYNKLLQINGFISLTEKEIKYILGIRFLSLDNVQLGQISSQLYDLKQIKSSSFFINLRLIQLKTVIIKPYSKKLQLKDESFGKNFFAEDDYIYWTKYKYSSAQGQLQIKKINDQFDSSVEIKTTGQIQSILITKKYLFCSVFGVDQTYPTTTCWLIGFRKYKNYKKQFNIYQKIKGSYQNYFKQIYKSLVIFNGSDRGNFILFCLNTQKIIYTIRKRSSIIYYSKNQNQLVLLENSSLNFYNFNKKTLENKIFMLLPLQVGQYQYLKHKQELIACCVQLTVQSINYQNQSSKIIKSLNNVFQFSFNKKHYYLIIFTEENEIIFLDSNYFLIKRIKWKKFEFTYFSNFITNKDMKYIFIRKSYELDKSKLKIYRCQIAD